MSKFNDLDNKKKGLLIPMRKTKVSARSQPAARGASTLENPYNRPDWLKLSEEERRFIIGVHAEITRIVEERKRKRKMEEG